MVFTFAVAVAEKLWLLKGLWAFAGEWGAVHIAELGNINSKKWETKC